MQESEAVTFPENAWVHVAVVHGGDGTATLFLNGRNCAKGPVALPSHVPRGACLHLRSKPSLLAADRKAL